MEQAITKRSYLAGLCIVIASVYAQYVLIHLGPFVNAMIVYGLPVFSISWLCGAGIIRKAFHNGASALRYGMSSFGTLYIAGNMVAAGILFILSALDPAALKIMHRANPVLHVRPDHAWFMVLASFLMIGPAEEYIYRGFIFGGLLRIFNNRHWFIIALFSSMLFAAMHLYYILIYGVASVITFVEITAFGIAMALTYYMSGGNLLIPAMIHGAFDATGFIASDISFPVGVALRQMMVWTGVLVAFSFWGSSRKIKEKIPGDL